MMRGFFGNLVCMNLFSKFVQVGNNIKFINFIFILYLIRYKNIIFLGGSYIVEDSAYPCLEYLIVPYRDNGHLTRA